MFPLLHSVAVICFFVEQGTQHRCMMQKPRLITFSTRKLHNRFKKIWYGEGEAKNYLFQILK